MRTSRLTKTALRKTAVRALDVGVQTDALDEGTQRTPTIVDDRLAKPADREWKLGRSDPYALAEVRQLSPAARAALAAAEQQHSAHIKTLKRPASRVATSPKRGPR